MKLSLLLVTLTFQPFGPARPCPRVAPRSVSVSADHRSIESGAGVAVAGEMLGYSGSDSCC